VKVQELKPVKESNQDFDRMEKIIRELFRKEIYLPLVRELGLPTQTTLKNAKDDVLAAISKGKISFYRGHFHGTFTAEISKELKELGAQWDRKTKTWAISQSALSTEMRSAISMSQSKFQRVLEAIDTRLAKILPQQIAEKAKLQPIFDSVLWKTAGSLKESMKAVTVSPSLTKEQSAEIAKNYTQDLKRHIKEFTEKEVTSLREKIVESSLKGNRYEGLVKTIQKSYDVSLNKAKFLARQETGLMMAAFKQARYTAAGLNEYKWCTVKGTALHPVRPMHKALEGKVFRWDSPPVTSEKGDRNNPGQDYNCRCFAKPIVKFNE
jgi:SPP1 gp7 family putative phage head morphogenesis protein